MLLHAVQARSRMRARTVRSPEITTTMCRRGRARLRQGSSAATVGGSRAGVEAGYEVICGGDDVIGLGILVSGQRSQGSKRNRFRPFPAPAALAMVAAHPCHSSLGERGRGE